MTCFFWFFPGNAGVEELCHTSRTHVESSHIMPISCLEGLWRGCTDRDGYGLDVWRLLLHMLPHAASYGIVSGTPSHPYLSLFTHFHNSSFIFPDIFPSTLCKTQHKMVSYDHMTLFCLRLVFCCLLTTCLSLCTCNKTLSDFFTCNKSILCKKEA